MGELIQFKPRTGYVHEDEVDVTDDPSPFFEETEALWTAIFDDVCVRNAEALGLEGAHAQRYAIGEAMLACGAFERALELGLDDDDALEIADHVGDTFYTWFANSVAAVRR